MSRAAVLMALLWLVACERTLAVRTVEPPGVQPVAVELPADDKGEVGWYPALRRGSTGTLHLAYCDKSNGDVRYGRRGDDGVLRLETVAAYGAVGKYIALAVDDADQPHLLYHDQDTKYLKYTLRQAEGWLQVPRVEGELTSLPDEAERHERLAWGAEVGMGSRLLVHQGIAYALYYANRRDGGQLFMAVRKPLSEAPFGSEGAWHEEEIDRADGSWSIWTDLVISGDQLVASYPHWNWVDSELRLAQRPLAGGAWSVRVAYPLKKMTPGWMSSLVPTPDQGLWMAFTGLRRERIFVGPVPVDDDMVDTPVLGYFINRIRMKRAGNGDFVLAAAETGKGSLGDSILALFRRHDGQWTRYPVDTRRPVASQMDLAVTPEGKAIILYYGDGTRGLWLYDESQSTRVEDSRPAPASAPSSRPASQPASQPASRPSR
ncbi:MAG: hypothetical protein ABIJ09_09080 [Pseudomonadota bacterium]